MWNRKEWLIFYFEKYLKDKTLGKLNDLREFINTPSFQRAFEGGFHYEEEAKSKYVTFTDEALAELKAFKDFIKSPEFQKIVREGGLKDEKIVKHLRENTIIGNSIDRPEFQNWIKPGLKEDPEVQAILSQVNKEYEDLKKIGAIEWNKRIEEERKIKEEQRKSKEPVKENPKKWLPIYFNDYLNRPTKTWLVNVKEYLDRSGVQAELKGQFKDDEELQSIASQVNKLWNDYQRDEEEKKNRYLEELEKYEQERKRYQMEQEEEERKRRRSESNIPNFD
jgi:hypothetical protein